MNIKKYTHYIYALEEKVVHIYDAYHGILAANVFYTRSLRVTLE